VRALALVLAVLSCCGAETRPLIGVNYFAGWWRPEPNKWRSRSGEEWLVRFPGRFPLLGAFNEQDTMDREILAAAGHGINFFAILWYAANPGVRVDPHAELLNQGVATFLQSRYAGRMKFFIEYCNHPPFGVTEEEAWQRCVRTWLAAMRHPSYLRAGGLPVFKVHGVSHFLRQHGGDIEAGRERLDAFRRAARTAGIGEILIGAGVGPGESIRAGHPAARLFDFTACYMGVPPMPQRTEDYPYSAVREFAATNRRKHSGDVIPHMPYVPAGWNPRPWGDPRAAFALPNRSEWRAALKEIATDLSAGVFGLPTNGNVRSAFTIYAWNEFGEGGIVAPTREDRYMKLEVIREVFGTHRKEK
jgi:hypothetical protein